ncbi:MAG: hypothetical protein GY859_27140, partial [Desulfobacterales bacterium]|nr:hypothetical protein [Desulfobacterales bacterium]
YTREENESVQDHGRRLEKLFDAIEPDCGLLTLTDGQYNFRHLLFQEFLTAAAIVDNERDYEKAISTYWEDPWFAEVVALFIGYLSIENRRWANDIIAAVLNADDAIPFQRWRLAAQSFLDIHEDRRESPVLELARRRLEEIISSAAPPKGRANSGEILGWLGDPRDFKEFVRIEGGEYDLEEIGKV